MGLSFVQKMASVQAQLEALSGEVQSEIAKIGAAYLNSDANKDGFDVVYFGGYTPSFNDGDACYFSMSGICGQKFETVDGEEELTPEVLQECIDEIYSPDEGEDLGEDNQFVQAVNLLESTGLLERVFETTGFIFVIDKMGNFYDKEYDCGY